MKTLILIPFLIFFSCAKHESKETTNPYDNVQRIAAGYIDQIKDAGDVQIFRDRCDHLIFMSLASAFVGERDLADYEWASGEWHRDTVECYPNFARSEISFDGLIGVLHDAWSRQDMDLLKRMNDYAIRHNYVMGKGDTEFTRIPQIGLIINDMLGAGLYSPKLAYAGSHREHILALSAWLKLRYAGYLEAHDLFILRNLKPNPLLTALLDRVDDGNQDRAIKYLSKFPETLPLDVGVEGWGGAPRWLYLLLIKAVLDGK